MQVWCFGDFCQGSMSSKYGGLQCTMIALFALALSYMLPCNEWNATTMNEALTHGNTLYTAYIDNYMNGIPQYLAHDQLEILHDLDIMGALVEPTIHSNLFYGAVGVNPEADSLAASLTDALDTSFQLSSHALVTFNDLSIALVTNNGQYFLFDSHARNALGQTCEFGTSVLLYFESFNDLIAHLLEMYNSCMFNISPVQFTSQCAGTTEINNINGVDEMEVIQCERVGNRHQCSNEQRTGINDLSINNETKNLLSENIASSHSIDITNNDMHSIIYAKIQDDSEGMEIETDHPLHQPSIIRIECDDVQKAINPFIDHTYHNRHNNMVSISHDHG